MWFVLEGQFVQQYVGLPRGVRPCSLNGIGQADRGHAQKLKCGNHEMLSQFSNQTFIHIPKTGGTSFESRLGADQAIIHRFNKPPTHPWLSPWHFPPDLYEKYYGVKFDRPLHNGRFCIIRDPVERYSSCQNWSKGKFKRSAISLASDYLNWNSVTPTEELLHRMPQTMFIFDRKGQVQCDCVISFNKLSLFNVPKINSRPHHHMTMPKEFEYLYRHDALLFSAASKEKNVCYHPSLRVHEWKVSWSDKATKVEKLSNHS